MLRHLGFVLLGRREALFVRSKAIISDTKYYSVLVAVGIKAKNVGALSHKILAKIKRYHDFPRVVYDRVHIHYQEINYKITLQIAIMAWNDRSSPESTLPFIFVFQVLAPMPVHPEKLLLQ